DPITAGADVAEQVMTPLVVFTAEKVTVCVATVPAAAGGPVSLKVPLVPMRRTISSATAAETVSDVAPLAPAAPSTPRMLGAYFPLEVILPSSSPARSTS